VASPAEWAAFLGGPPAVQVQLVPSPVVPADFLAGLVLSALPHVEELVLGQDSFEHAVRVLTVPGSELRAAAEAAVQHWEEFRGSLMADFSPAALVA
jgi:hypothetical protein